MGTRSTTKIYEDFGDNSGEHLLLSLYKQFDGYIDGGWGDELKKFFNSGKLVNGISLENNERIFNGAGDFALQLVTEYKDGAGGLYATFETDSQEYNYKIVFKHVKIPEEDEKLEKYEQHVIFTCEEEPKYEKEFIVKSPYW
ncbi:hypothetical protein [Methanoculleus sp.]|uniref:hypothetical protein n=1 Tax=Methanoculleus sp. TaxID=90427 RepID=UPI0025D17DE6|nr:hypothetical protein [Methanoculleus sp.]MCK9320115.1 hypothetical protein [Methanoculleus sp.]